MGSSESVPQSCNKSEFVDGLASLLANNELHDCSFEFDNNDNKIKLSANRAILANVSPVFKAMFYGKMKEQGEIHITDISSECFQVMLAFIYTGHVTITVDNIGELWYCANKYMLQSLEELCDNYVTKSLEDKNNYELILRFLNTIPKSIIPEKTYNLLILELRKKAELIVKSPYYMNISLDLLRLILSQNMLNIKEDGLFFATLKWCEAKLEKVGLPANEQNKRKMLKKCEYLIRFGSMTMEEFVNCNNYEPGFFTGDEFKDIICDIHNKTKKSQFSQNKRNKA